MSKNEKKIRALLKDWDASFPDHKKVWRQLVRAADVIGWKSLHLMVLQLQSKLPKEEVGEYKIKRNYR